MTVKSLQQIALERSNQYSLFESPQLIELLSRLKGSTFVQSWDIIGRPLKDGKPQPIHDYEFNILKLLKTYRHMWIKKCTGLGITELFLRYIIWRCCVNNSWRNRQVPIVVGPNLDLAIKLIKRIKKLFEPHGVYFEDKHKHKSYPGANWITVT